MFLQADWSDPFFIIEVICITWFTFEFIVRFATCPEKGVFIKNFLNIIGKRFMRVFVKGASFSDLMAIVPFFVNLAINTDEEGSGGSGGMQFAVLRVLRLVRAFLVNFSPQKSIQVRVFRIFKLSRHSVGLQILGKTFRASLQEFCLLIFFLCIALVLFASGMYFAEGAGQDPPEKDEYG